jgi:hypothetical protein
MRSLIQRRLASTLLCCSGFSISVGSSMARAGADGSTKYQVLKTIRLDGVDDHNDLAIDIKDRLLYVTEQKHIEAFDVDTGVSRGQIADTPHLHGIALAPDFRSGFATNGLTNTTTILDLQALKTFSVVTTVDKPNDVLYDDVSKRAFVMSHRSQSITVIKVMDGTVAATIPLPEEPEGAILDGRGHLYVNLSDPSEIAVIDTVKLVISKRSPLKGCVEPSAITMDVNNSRLLLACANEIVAVVDPDNGDVVGRIPMGRSVLVMYFDSTGQFAITADAVGNLSFIQSKSQNSYRVVNSIKIKARAIAMAADSKTDQIFILANELIPRSKSHNHSTVKPNSSVLLVLGKP